MRIKNVVFNDANNACIVAENPSLNGFSWVARTNNSGNNWSITFSTDYKLNNVYYPEQSNIFAVGSRHIYVSNNSGSTWSDWYIENMEFFDARFQNALSAYVCGRETNANGRAILVRSSNSGITWNFVFSFFHQKALYCIRFPNPFIGYCCGEGGLMLKVVEGVTPWLTQNTGTTANLNYMYFFDENTGYAVGNGGVMLKTTNGGAPWFFVYPGFSGVNFTSIHFKSSMVGYLTGVNGFIARTTDGGINWIQQQTPVNTGINGLSFVNSDTLFAVGDSGKVLRTYNGGVIGVNLISEMISTEFALMQNYPNPFNPSTQIGFDIPKSSMVKLIVYDFIGREIEVLVNERLETGRYLYDWNASDYPSGIYFYKIQAGKYVKTKKMVFIK